MKLQLSVLGAVVSMAMMLAGLLAGCEEDRYTITMQPTEHGLRRETQVERHPSGGESPTGGVATLPHDEVEYLAKLYGVEPPKGDTTKFTASRSFTDRTPADVGGAGVLKTFPSTMGKAYYYVERFRGTDDLASDLRAREAAADAVVDVTIEWLRAELGGEPGFESLRQFADTTFRRDVKNIGLRFFAAMAALSDTNHVDDHGAAMATFGSGVFLYLFEHGYVNVEDLDSTEWDHGVPSPENATLVRVMARTVAARAQMDPAHLPASMEFLRSKENAAASWERFITSDRARPRLLAWATASGQIPDAESKSTSDLVSYAVATVVGVRFLETYDAIIVRMACPAEPIATNGKWNKDEARIEWAGQIDQERDAKAPGVPAMCFATWSVPSDDFQKTHFGSVALTQQQLLTYCTWRNSLPLREGAEWDAFVAGFKASDDIKVVQDRILTFQFSGGSTVDPQPGLEALRGFDPANRKKPASK